MFQTYINIKDRMEYYHVVGLSVSYINNGRMSGIENYGLLEAGTSKKVDNHSLFNACSISKFLTALTVLKLTEQGIFDLDEDVNKKLSFWNLPYHSWAENKNITLRNLLSHQSGVMDPPGSFGELDPYIGFPSMAEILAGRTPYCKTPIGMMYEPESDFQYSDTGFCIIQQVIEDVTGKSFQEVVKELIFEPLEMANSTFLQNMLEKVDENVASGHNKYGQLVDGKYSIYPYPAAAGLWTTASDLSKLLLELMDALHHNSKIGISANTIKEMVSSQGCKSWTGLGVFLDGSGKEVEISSLGWGEDINV